MVRGGTVLLEPLAEPDDLFPSTKCYPELTRPHIDLCWLSHSAHFRPRTRMVKWCHAWKWQPRQCTLKSLMVFVDSAQGMCFPKRCWFWSSYDPTIENVPCLKTRHCQGAHFDHIFWILINQRFFKFFQSIDFIFYSFLKPNILLIYVKCCNHINKTLEIIQVLVMIVFWVTLYK